MNKENRFWDAGRFVQTLAYFEVIPFLNWLGQLIQGHPHDNKATVGGKDVGVILVAGATGGVGKRVVQRLVEHGYQVRSLVRNVQKAKEILGNNVELLRETLPSQRL